MCTHYWFSVHASGYMSQCSICWRPYYIMHVSSKYMYVVPYKCVKGQCVCLFKNVVNSLGTCTCMYPLRMSLHKQNWLGHVYQDKINRQVLCIPYMYKVSFGTILAGCMCRAYHTFTCLPLSHTFTVVTNCVLMCLNVLSKTNRHLATTRANCDWGCVYDGLFMSHDHFLL